ncbi:hypothetical protein [Streptomyces sp. NPDC005732]|uniref:hypothetical protein n=1 Tax=Streptomyces sp. NPDC005732 TaxID=3157057 RepID=UPI0033FBA494
MTAFFAVGTPVVLEDMHWAVASLFTREFSDSEEFAAAFFCGVPSLGMEAWSLLRGCGCGRARSSRHATA